eukprot:6454000-Pyramimonas_sp.AAC.1
MLSQELAKHVQLVSLGDRVVRFWVGQPLDYDANIAGPSESVGPSRGPPRGPTRTQEPWASTRHILLPLVVMPPSS